MTAKVVSHVKVRRLKENRKEKTAENSERKKVGETGKKETEIMKLQKWYKYFPGIHEK